MKMPQVMRLLGNYEILFPYRVFVSPHYTVGEMRCSICGLETKDPGCPHITGHLYKGRIAKKNIKYKKIIEISLVKNPANKKCIVNITNEDYNYRGISEAIKRIKHPLMDFDVYGIYENNPKGRRIVIDGIILYEFLDVNIGFIPRHIECHLGRNDLRI